MVDVYDSRIFSFGTGNWFLLFQTICLFLPVSSNYSVQFNGNPNAVFNEQYSFLIDFNSKKIRGYIYNLRRLPIIRSTVTFCRSYNLQAENWFSWRVPIAISSILPFLPHYPKPFETSSFLSWDSIYKKLFVFGFKIKIF